MPKRPSPIARIALARSLRRVLALPAVLFVVGLASIVYALVVSGVPAGLPMIVVGAAVIVTALTVALWPLSVRLDVEESAVRVHWLGGERLYVLVPGPVTRVRLRGDGASKLRAQPRLAPWQFGRGLLRDEEAIEVVRLAATETAILVPTGRGRLAIAAESEEALLDALTRAAHARQRLEEIARQAPPPVEEPPPLPALPAAVDPELMTGIQRALVERRLEEERAARAVAAPEAAEPEPADAAAIPQPEERRRRLGLPWRRAAPGEAAARRRPHPSWVLIILPLAGAGVAWAIGAVFDRMPDATSDVGRLTALALVLAGPATTVAAIMARIWWPRLVAVVVAGGLTTAVFVGRSLIGA